MSIHPQTKRTTLPALLVVASLALTPAAAAASSLLSGYGGPGEGSQVVLGGHLIGGGGGGGGGGSTGGGAGAGTSSAAAGAGAGVPAQTRAAGGSSSAVARSRAAGTSGTSPRGPVRGSSSAGASITYPSYSTTGYQAVTTGSDPLGLSGVDLIFVLVAAALIAFTGVLTRRLAQRPQEATIGARHFDRTGPQ